MTFLTQLNRRCEPRIPTRVARFVQSQQTLAHEIVRACRFLNVESTVRIIAAVRLAREDDVSRPSPRVTFAISQSVA